MKIFLFSCVSLFLTQPLFASPYFAASSLSLISGPSELCTEGTLRIVGEKNEAILMVGPVLSFSLHAEESVGQSADGKCRESIKRKIDKNKISQTTITSSCSVELKNLEGAILQELEVLPEQVIYKRTEGKAVSTCLYKRKLK